MAIQLLTLPVIGLVHSFCSVPHHRFDKGEVGVTGSLGAYPQPPTIFYDFRIKPLILALFFIKKAV